MPCSRTRGTTSVEHALRVRVFNRLCDPESKLGVPRWLETVSVPELDTADITHQQLLRSIDALMDHQDAVDDVVAGLLRPRIVQDLWLVFYDLTTLRAAGLSKQIDDVRRYGMAKEGVIARQFMLGVAQTSAGLPTYHGAFGGKQPAQPTLLPTLQKVLGRFAHSLHLIVVADRGLLSLDNIDELGKVKLPVGQPLQFILAVPGRRYGEFASLLSGLQARTAGVTEEIIEETRWNDLRLVVAHDPQTALRRQRIEQLGARAGQLAGKLDAQDAGELRRGRKLSYSGAKARLHHEVCDADLARSVKVDLKIDLFSYTTDEAARAQAELRCSKLLLVTNVQDFSPPKVVHRYKALADIERGFKVLKSEIECAPVCPRRPERIRAHAMLCFMELIVYRVMRQRLKLAKSDLSPKRAIEKRRRIQRRSVGINAGAPMSGVSTINTPPYWPP